MNLECSKTKGVLYNNIWIFKFRDYFSFVAKNYKGEFKELYKFYYKRESSISLRQVSLTQKDFAHLPLNKYGFKEIATSGDYTLVVLYNDTLVVYHNDVPSLLGLPSTEPLLSGIYLDEKGSLVHPSASIFKHNILVSYMSYYFMCVYRSSSIDESKIGSIISGIITPQGYLEYEEYTVFSLFNDEDRVTDSDFIKRYPSISSKFLNQINDMKSKNEIKFNIN